MFVQLVLRAGGSVFVRIESILAVRPFTGGQSDVFVARHVFETTASPNDLRSVISGRAQTTLTIVQ